MLEYVHRITAFISPIEIQHSHRPDTRTVLQLALRRSALRNLRSQFPGLIGWVEWVGSGQARCCRKLPFDYDPAKILRYHKLLRKWWNWQTHHLEGVAPKGVGVQIPPSAPWFSHRQIQVDSSCYPFRTAHTWFTVSLSSFIY